MPTPANLIYHFVIQDNRGFRANLKIAAFTSDVVTDASTVGAVATDVAAVATVLQAMTNAKVVRSGFGWDFNYAQEPSSETGTYELVTQKARLQGGDGAGAFQSVDIPAPKDALFLTTASENLIVVDPASSLVTNFQGALVQIDTPRGGHPFQQFFGGQLVSGKPRRRRVLQGA